MYATKDVLVISIINQCYGIALMCLQNNFYRKKIIVHGQRIPQHPTLIGSFANDLEFQGQN